MNTSLFQQDIISISDLTRENLLNIVQHARHVKESPDNYHLKNKIIATCFFEPSTRTRLSFESAALRLDAKTLGFSDSNSTSSGAKGETLQDSIRVIASYVDLIVLRHPREGAARLAALASDKPVINAGDGANQHPTQTLVDLFTIKECQEDLDNLHIAFVGDLKYGRTVHSLLQALSLFNCRFYFVSPSSLMLPEYMAESLRRLGIKFSFHKTIKEIISKVDILYMTRLQKERLIHSESHEFYQCSLVKSDLDQVKDNLRILHPLPRIKELTMDIDATPYAYYFEQAANGVCVRQALLHMILSQN